MAKNKNKHKNRADESTPESDSCTEPVQDAIWVKPSGVEVELNPTGANIEAAKKLGWEKKD